jgi:23S rRNA pseudouridine1911/1915/1917 synthase
MIQDIVQDETAEQSELYEHHRIVADPGQSLLRIDKFLSNRLEKVSRNKIQIALRAGNVLVNNNSAKPNYRIKPGDVISVVLPYPHRELEIVPEPLPLHILYEDEHIIVVNKEAGMVVHPGHGNYTGTLVNALCWHLKDLPLFQSAEIRPGLVHRIDKETSGILVIAKTVLALNRLARQFFERTTQRTYQAIVWGVPDPPQGTISGNIGRSLRDRLKMQIFPEGDAGKTAVTHYRVIEALGYISLVECKLETGRTHQIRAHMEYIRHPIFNDERYGGNRILRGTEFSKYRQFVENCFNSIPRHALHAKSLGFQHPETGQAMYFNSELPSDMQQLLEKWRRYISSRLPD